jgi:hypothetical protein
VVERVTKINITFYSSEGWESDGPRRVIDGGDSMLWFRLKRRSNKTKHCPKIKRRQ